MQFDTLVLGAYENNCYIVRKDNSSSDCLIIDTGLDAAPLLEELADRNLNPLALVLTHGHGDHIAGVEFLRRAYKNMRVYIHKADAEMLTSAAKNFSALVGEKIESGPADVLIETEGRMDFVGFKFDIIHTPGHTAGGICLYSPEDDIIFTGDTLFAGSVGRTDFAGADARKCMRQLIENIKTKLLTLPDNTKVLPGHGPATTIGLEKKHNPYLN
jgi:hydroxyacylglutathione hydrolase